jgi:hypothetical protein
VERPLAEVFSVMPRCAPLRLPQGEASGGPFSRTLANMHLRTQERVAFALGRKLLLFFTELLCSTRPLSTPGASFALPFQPQPSGSSVQESVRAHRPAHWPKRFLFRYNLVTFIAPLAQLDRASGYEPEGREFESLRARHSSQAHSGTGAVSPLGATSCNWTFSLGGISNPSPQYGGTYDEVPPQMKAVYGEVWIKVDNDWKLLWVQETKLK